MQKNVSSICNIHNIPNICYLIQEMPHLQHVPTLPRAIHYRLCRIHLGWCKYGKGNYKTIFEFMFPRQKDNIWKKLFLPQYGQIKVLLPKVHYYEKIMKNLIKYKFRAKTRQLFIPSMLFICSNFRACTFFAVLSS